MAYETDATDDSRTHLTISIALLIAFGSLAGFNLVGNSLVIIATSVSKRCRYPLAVLFVNLAICDLTSLVRLLEQSISILIQLGVEVGQLHGYVCETAQYARAGFFFGQIFSLLGIAVNRYMKITNSALYIKYLSMKGHILTLPCIWGISVLLAIVIPHAWGYHHLGTIKDMNGTYMCVSVMVEKKSLILWTLTGIIPVVSAVAVLLLCYGKIFHFTYRTHVELRDAAGCDGHFPPASRSLKNLKMHIITVSIVAASLLISFSTHVLKFYAPSPYLHHINVVAILGNSSLNPWLICLYVPDFNETCRDLAACRMPRTRLRKKSVAVISPKF